MLDEALYTMYTRHISNNFNQKSLFKLKIKKKKNAHRVLCALGEKKVCRKDETIF